MTKKFFVVLVVITAMLLSFSLVLAAKKAPFKGEPVSHEKQVLSQKQVTLPVSTLGTEPQRLQGDLVSSTGMRVGTTEPIQGSATPLVTIDKTDLCDMYGSPVYYWTNYIWGLELWANFQEPYEYGCLDVFPFDVDGIQFDMNVPTALSVDVRFIVFANAGTECPIPGAELCTTPVYTFDIPDAGWWTLIADFDAPCCVYEPFFAGVEILTDFSGLEDKPDAVVGDDGLICQSYNYFLGEWYDCVVDYGGPGMLMLSAYGHTRLQNTCVEEPVCCQFDGYCDYMTPTECINAGGTPAPDARYECIDNACILPWLQAGCDVVSVEPLRDRVLAGDQATFTVTVEFIGTATECLLSATPDPACPDCGTAVFTPNPIVAPNTTSTLTIQTAVTTPGDRYEFAVNGAGTKGNIAYVEVIEPGTECDLKMDWGSGSHWYYSGWAEGEQNAIVLDPGAWCVACEGDVYPLWLQTIKGNLYNHAGIGETDVIFHIFDLQGGDPCNGPGVELYSFEATIDVFAWDDFEVPVPERVCINGPFFLSLEYLGTSGSIPSLLWDRTQTAPNCAMFAYWTGAWYEWHDLWGPGDGYLTLWAVGTCADPYCSPGEACDMQQDNGNISSIGGFWGEGMKEAKYYDPEQYCTAPVYPYMISDVTVGMYDYFGAGSGTYQFGVYLQCEDVCDGPGTQIYLSADTTFDTFPALHTIDFPDVICVYEPFYISVECVAPATSAPQVINDDNPPVDTCHNWFWYAGESPPWIEHWDFWSDPAGVGYPMIRVSGYTDHGDCHPPSCSEDVEQIQGGTFPYYAWRLPDAYGDNFFNERYEMPADHGGRLEYFNIAYSATWIRGTPDPDYYVWLSDGLFPLDYNPPYQAIAEIHQTYDDIVLFPGWTSVETYHLNVTFEPGELFHIGYSHGFEVGDTLAVISDDGSFVSDRSSEWWGVWGTMLDDWGVGVDFYMDAYICPFAPEGSTFTMKCRPSIGYATPGDPPVDVYTIEMLPVIGYALPVTMSLLSVDPPAAINATFIPNGVPPPDTLDVAITVDVGVAYGDYTLTFQGVGDDGQTKTCDVTLTVQPPFDEATVDFFHGFQRTSNFGAVGNDVRDNFVWYGTNYLFDGSVISAVPGDPQADHFALDVYNCEHVGFIPSQHLVKTYDPWCPGSPYEEYYGEVAYSNFYTEEDVISCEYDSFFVIGLKDVDCTDFSIKIKIYYNPTQTQIPELWISLFEDWDIGDAYNNWVEIDPDHNLVWQWDVADPSIVFGILKAPFYDEPMHSIVGVNNAYYVWPNSGFCDDAAGWHGLDSLWYLMTRAGYYPPVNINADSNDMSLLMTPPPFALNPGDKHMEIWIDFGRNLNDGFTWEQWYHKILRYVGFYRGDVNASDTLELPALDVSDLVYLINYLYKGGPAPLPFADQGDVDGHPNPKDAACPKNNVNAGDVVYLINYVWKGGPPPVDYVRFIEQYWSRPSLFTNPNW